MDALAVLVVSSLTPKLLELLKQRAWFPLMDVSAPVLNRVTPLAVALLTATGVTWQFDDATGTLTLSGLVASDIVRGLLLWGAGAAMQHGVYESWVREDRRG